MTNDQYAIRAQERRRISRRSQVIARHFCLMFGIVWRPVRLFCKHSPESLTMSELSKEEKTASVLWDWKPNIPCTLHTGVYYSTDHPDHPNDSDQCITHWLCNCGEDLIINSTVLGPDIPHNRKAPKFSIEEMLKRLIDMVYCWNLSGDPVFNKEDNTRIYECSIETLNNEAVSCEQGATPYIAVVAAIAKIYDLAHS